MSNKLSVAFALTTLVAPAFLPAQTNNRVVPWIAPYLSAPSSDVTAFAENGRTHLMIAKGGDAVLAWYPAEYQSLNEIPLPGSVTGMATIVDDGGDRCLLTGTSGANLIQLQATGSTVVTSVLDATWNGATDVVARLGMFNGAAVHGVAAIDAGGTFVLTATVDAAFAVQAEASINVGVPVLGVEVMDWDGDGDEDAVAVTAAGLAPYTLDGTALAIVPGALSNPVTTVFPGVSGDRLAMVFGFAGFHWLALMDGQASDVPVLLNTSLLQTGGAIVATDLAVNDIDGDSDFDVMLTHAGNSSRLLLRNTAASPTTFLQEAVDLESPVVPSVSGPSLWQDMDNSGLPDAVLLQDPADRILVGVDADVSTPPVDSLDWLLFAGFEAEKLTLEIDASLNDGFEKIEIVVWHQDNPTSQPGPPLDPTATHNRSWTVSSVYNASDPNDLTKPPYYEIDFFLDPNRTPSLPDPLWPDGDHYYIGIRFFTGTAHSQTWKAGMTLRKTTLDDPFAYLTGLDEETGGTKHSDPVETRAEIVGGIIINIKVPSFGSGVPNPGQ